MLELLVKLILVVTTALGLLVMVMGRTRYGVIAYMIISQFYPSLYPGIDLPLGLSIRVDDLLVAALVLMALVSTRQRGAPVGTERMLIRAMWLFLGAQVLAWGGSFFSEFAYTSEHRLMQTRTVLKNIEIGLVALAIPRLLKRTDVESCTRWLVGLLATQSAVILLSLAVPSLQVMIASLTAHDAHSPAQLGFVEDKNVAGFMIITAFWMVPMLKKRRAVMLALAFLLFASIVLAACKTAMVTCAITFVLAAVLVKKRHERRYLASMLGLMTVAMMAGVMIMPDRVLGPLDDLRTLLQHITRGDESVLFGSSLAHVYQLLLSWIVLVHAPVLGFGPAGFSFYADLNLDLNQMPNILMMREAETFLFSTEGHWGGDNQYVATLYSAGLVGLASLISFWFILLRQCFRAVRFGMPCLPDLLVVLTILICFFGKTGFFYLGNSLYALVVCVVGLIIARLRWFEEDARICHVAMTMPVSESVKRQV